MDAYQKFLNHFSIDWQALLEWGVEETIFPPVEKVAQEWDALKTRVLTNQPVYIRGYGRNGHGTQLYVDLYKALFGNEQVKEDPTNNYIPRKCIQRVTGLKRNKDIYNYQISHIWGHTKNVFLFEAPWNICYTPKIMDPFTGHEAKGVWPAEYQKKFLDKATALYRMFVVDYNKLIKDLDIYEQIDRYMNRIEGTIPEKELAQFKEDVISEFQPLKLND